jgi:chromosomal replication initiator protein
MKPKGNKLNPTNTFDNFISGASNELAVAVSTEVAANPSQTYNPLTIYGSTGLGKTHLMHAIGLGANNSKVIYVKSTRFVREMISAIQAGTINKFTSFYRSADILLFDTIQFLKDKDRSSEELLSIVDHCLTENIQLVFTSNEKPKDFPPD